MRKIKKLIAIFMTFYLISLMMSFLGFQSAYANAMEMPSNYMDVEVKFIVYPDGTVGLSSKYNYTSPYPYLGQTVQVSAQITKDGDMYAASIDTTLTVPPEEASKFPFNATEAFMSYEYSNGILNSDINASIILPDRWYMDGYPEVFPYPDFSGFPFNSTDFVISGEYSNQAFNGTITLHMVPGLALGDVDIHLEGNTTQITISDSVKIFYDTPLPIPGFTPLNEIYLNELLQMLNSTIPGEGSESLYDMTDGMFTCTTFNTALTPIENGAEVSFLIIIRGDFINALTEILTGVSPPLEPSIYPPLNATTIYSLLNATIYSMKTGDFTMSYSRTAKKLDLQASFTQNLEEYLNATTQMMPAMYPPEMQPYLELMLNTTYCSAHSYTETISYIDGQMNYKGDYTFEGDLSAQVNHIKNVYIDMLNAINPGPEWLVTTLKETAVDVSNLRFNLNLGDYSQLWNFEGVKVASPVYRINATCFMLEKFFNITSSQYGEPPRRNERMKLIVRGGSNGTHTVTLFIDPTDPERVPDPDEFAEGNTMIWNNQSISKLKRLMFRVWEGYVEAVYNPASITQDNPFMIDAEETASCVLTLTNISKPATLYIKNITAPADFSLPPETYKVLGSYIQITAEPEDVTVNVTIRIYYTPEQLSELELDENSLKIFYWNEATNNWEAIDTQINTTEHYVWATVSHLSIWTLMGQPLPALWEQPWFLISITAIIIIVIVAVLLSLRRKKQSP